MFKMSWSFEYIVISPVKMDSEAAPILNYVWFPLCCQIFELVQDSDHEVLSSQFCKLSVHIQITFTFKANLQRSM